MKRKTALAMLGVLGFFGSFVMFYMLNLTLSDLSNMFYGVHDAFIITSFPGFTWALEFVACTMFVFRIYSHPQYKKRTIKLYSVLLSIISLIGLLTSLISKFVYYEGVKDMYPFRGYITIFSLVHAVNFVLGLIIFMRASALPKDKEKRKIKFWYVLYSIMLFLLILFAYDRFGALLWMPVYVHMRTLYLTWPFYVSLILPMAVLFQYVLFEFGVYKDHPKLEIRYQIITLIANAVFCALVCILGSKYTQFISAVSPALALERLATMPIDTILHFGLGFIFGFYNLFNSIRYRKKKEKKEKKNA